MTHKHKAFSSGIDIKSKNASVQYYKIFLLLIAIHGAIFIMPQGKEASIILLFTLIRGWHNGL